MIVALAPVAGLVSTGIAVVRGRLAVDRDVGHGEVVGGLAPALLDDPLRGLVVRGVQDQLRHRQQRAQPVGDLQTANI